MIPAQVAAAVQHHWWLFLLRGVAALAFGVLTLAWPGATLLVLMAFIAAYALVDGIVAVVYAFRLRPVFDRWWMLLRCGECETWREVTVSNAIAQTPKAQAMYGPSRRRPKRS